MVSTKYPGQREVREVGTGDNEHEECGAEKKQERRPGTRCELCCRFAAAKPHVDVLLSQRKPQGWTSYALDANLLETACRVNAALERDADTRRALAADPTPTSASAVWLMPGLYDCYAPALLRLGRPAEALPLFEALHRGTSGAAGARFALGAARSQAALGRHDEARAWLARIPPAEARRNGLAVEIARLRRALRRN